MAESTLARTWKHGNLLMGGQGCDRRLIDAEPSYLQGVWGRLVPRPPLFLLIG